MEANITRTGEDQDGSLSFEQAAEDDQSMEQDGAQDSQRSRQSTMSSQSTFRDTNVDEADASSLMHCQNLASIVNNPKKQSLVKKMASMVKSKVVGSKEPKFKPLKESQVEDSTAIPKVNPQKDFRDYFRKVGQ